MHALLIEDEFLLRVFIEEELWALDYSSFDHAATMASAIRAAECRCPDLIVADHRIVGGTGTEAVLAICSGRPIPVVFVTASGDEVRARLPNALVVGKPFTTVELHTAVHRAIEAPFVHRIASGR